MAIFPLLLDILAGVAKQEKLLGNYEVVMR